MNIEDGGPVSCIRDRLLMLGPDVLLGVQPMLRDSYHAVSYSGPYRLDLEHECGSVVG